MCSLRDTTRIIRCPIILMETNSWFYFLVWEIQLIHIQFKQYFIIFFHLCTFHLWDSKTSNMKSQSCCAFCVQFLIKPVSVGEYSFWLVALYWSGLAQTVPEVPAAYIHRLSPCKALPYSQIFIRISWLSYVLNTNKVSTGGYAPLCHGLYCGMPRKTLFFKFLLIG